MGEKVSPCYLHSCYGS